MYQRRMFQTNTPIDQDETMDDRLQAMAEEQDKDVRFLEEIQEQMEFYP